MSNTFIYNGHLCFHELLHRKLDGKEYNNSENTVFWLKNNVCNAEDIYIYINFFNIVDIGGHLNMAPVDFPNIKKIHMVYAIEPEFNPAYASQLSINKFHAVIEKCHETIDQHGIECHIDTRLLKLEKKDIPFNDFIKITSKLGSLYWVEDQLDWFNFNITAEEYVDRMLNQGDAAHWPWYDALHYSFPDFSWDTYKYIIKENLKPFDAFNWHDPIEKK